MQGYRTYILAVLSFLAPVIARYGFKIDPDIIADAMILIIPPAIAIMRSITHTSPRQKR